MPALTQINIHLQKSLSSKGKTEYRRRRPQLQAVLALPSVIGEPEHHSILADTQMQILGNQNGPRDCRRNG